VLRPFAAITQAEIDRATRKTFEFERTNGAWAINDKFFDANRPLTTSPINTPERWKLVNKSGGRAHPLHIHVDFHRVLRRNGALPPLNERDGIARKDTTELGPNDEVEIFIKFRDFPGRFVFHCHNAEHEDHAMMARFDVLGVGGPNSC
jgi:FtsP/CotA-like multicopper oxidase with cupredoxin domain